MSDGVEGRRSGCGCRGVAAALVGCAIGLVVVVPLAVLLAWLLGVSIRFEQPPRAVPARASGPVFWPAPSIGEPLAWELHGTADYGCFGASIAVVPDRDADGWEDLVIGAFSAIDVFLPLGLGRAVDAPAGRVAIVSGATGAALRELETALDGAASGDPRLVFGAAVAGLGDVDGDGVGDVAVAACESSVLLLLPRIVQRLLGSAVVFVLSGSTNELLGSVPVRRAGWIGLASLGNLDGNVRWAILTQRIDAERTAEFEVTLVAGMSVVKRVTFEGGVAAHVSAGDLDGDAASDLVVATSHGEEHALVALSSRGGRELWRSRCGPVSMGVLAGLGDVDGDGVADLAAAVRREEGQAQRIELRSGANGHLLRELPGGIDPVSKGTSVTSLASMGDLDGDGRRELVLGRRDGIDVVWSDGWVGRAVPLPTPGPAPTMIPAGRTLVVLTGPSGDQILVWCDPIADSEGRTRGIVRAMRIERPR